MGTFVGFLLLLIGGGILFSQMNLPRGRRITLFPETREKWREVYPYLPYLRSLPPTWSIGVGIFGIVLLVYLFGILGVILSFLLFLFLPSRLLAYGRKKEIERFEAVLPNALDALTGALKSGLSFPQALRSVGERFPQPVGGVFQQATIQIQLGSPVGKALKEAGRNYPTQEWNLFVEAIDTLLKMGGNLTEITAKTSETIRKRQRIQERLKTLTAQGRFQAWILGALPIGMLLILKGLDPQLYTILTQTPIGWGILFIAFLLEGIAIFLIRKILTIEV
jgi:tight adherence protein B